MSQAPKNNQILGHDFALQNPSQLYPYIGQSLGYGTPVHDPLSASGLNRNLGRRLLLDESCIGPEVNLQNGSKLTMERRGDSIVIHIARNKDQSFFSWLCEAVGAAAYGVYSYGRDATLGVAWALSVLFPKDWDALQESLEIGEIVWDAIWTVATNFDKALIFLMIRLQSDTRGKSFIQSAARWGTATAVFQIGIRVPHPAAAIIAGGISAAAFAGMVYRIANDIRILKQKGESVENIGDVILMGIATGDTDLLSTREVLGSGIYDQINYMIDNNKLAFEFEDEELQFVNFLREEFAKMRRGMKHYLKTILDSID